MNLKIRRLETDSVESEIPMANRGLKTTGTKFKNLGRRNEEILSRFWLSSWASSHHGQKFALGSHCADWGAAPTRRQAPLQGANVHALQEDLDAHWGG